MGQVLSELFGKFYSNRKSQRLVDVTVNIKLFNPQIGLEIRMRRKRILFGKIFNMLMCGHKWDRWIIESTTPKPT